jgi:membrane protease YdiL (CAAX protease family)
MLLLFTLFSFTSVVLAFVLKPLFGFRLQEVLGVQVGSSLALKHAFIFAQVVANVSHFLLAALLFAQLSHPQPFAYLGLRKMQNPIQILLVFGLMLSFIPVMNHLGMWLQHFDWGEQAKLSYLKTQQQLASVMSEHTIPHLLLYLFAFAFVPAMGEELLFRGVIMRYSYQNAKNIHLAVLFSAAVFAMAHQSPFNFIPIMLAGILLGYIYYYTGSIWLSILAHFINNAFAVVALFYANHLGDTQQVQSNQALLSVLLIVSVALFSGVFFIFMKHTSPLPQDWSDDFKGEEASIN